MYIGGGMKGSGGVFYLLTECVSGWSGQVTDEEVEEE